MRWPLLLALASCAWWARIDPPNKAHLTPDCTGVDEQTCDPNRASASFCCDQHAGTAKAVYEAQAAVGVCLWQKCGRR